MLVDLLGIFIDEIFNEILKGISWMDFLDCILVYGYCENVFILVEKEVLV